MELFRNAIAVKLSHNDKYLVAEDDQENVFQARDGSCENAIWAVEFVEGEKNYLRLRSCYGKYLSASKVPFLPGATGRKVLQTLPKVMDFSLEWEPIRDGFSVRLKTRCGHFLRPNGGLPPWRNSVTHDIPHRMGTLEKILWDVEIIEAEGNRPLILKNLITPSNNNALFPKAPSVFRPLKYTKVKH